MNRWISGTYCFETWMMHLLFFLLRIVRPGRFVAVEPRTDGSITVAVAKLDPDDLAGRLRPARNNRSHLAHRSRVLA